MDIISLTKKLISIDSTNPGNFELDIKNFIEQFLKSLDSKKIKIYKSKVINNRENIMACFFSNKKNNKKKEEIILLCHMDTVVIGSGWTKNPFKPVDIDGKIYGRGSTDMKSGIAVSLKTFEYFVKNFDNSDINRDFKIIFTVDEEANMKGVEKAISDKWIKKNSFVCDLEPTDKIIQTSHKGRLWIKIDVFGKTAHASKPELGIDSNLCISELIHYINKNIKKLKKDNEMGNTTVTFGLLNGGYQPYVVPDFSAIYIDFRLTPPTTEKIVVNIINNGIKYVKKNINKNVKIKYNIVSFRPFIKINKNSKFLKYIVNTLTFFYKKNKNKNYKPQISFFSGYTDTAVIASKLNNKNIFSYGPGSLNFAHKPDEFVYKDDIKRCEEVYKKLIYDLIVK